MNNIVSLSPITNNCASCRWSHACVAQDLDPASLTELTRHVVHGSLKHGEKLFRQGDERHALYVIRAGSVKTYLDSEDGYEQAIGFHFPGDMLGFDAVANNSHPTSAVALETMAYCSIRYDHVASLAAKMPSLWHQVMRAAASQVKATQDHVLQLGQRSAPARLASFLLDLSQRFAARGCSKTEFNLSMSRQEIANYLAVAVETISRLFTDLQRRDVIAVERRFVKICSLPALQAIASETAPLLERIA